MVCRPASRTSGCTPGNCHDLLFDDVIWVHEAQKDHYDFVLKMRERGVEVLELHDMLAQTLDDQARAFVLDRRITANSVGSARASVIRPVARRDAAAQLAEHLIGGIASRDLPETRQAADPKRFGAHRFLTPPIPNTLFQRDPRAGSTAASPCNPMFWPARQPETLLQRRSTSSIRASRAATSDLVGRLRRGLRRRLVEGGDVMPIGKGSSDRHGRAHHAPGGVPGAQACFRHGRATA
jgi:arginine deiminase